MTPAVSRREWLAAAGLAVTPIAHSRDEPGRPLAPLNRFPRMVQERYVALVRDAERRAAAVREKLTTKADAEGYVRDVRRRIAESFGPFPARTPLNARVTGTVERDAYRIEKVIFDSRPGFPVTANLYLPKATGPRPGVVGECGHSVNGKAAEPYQGFAQGLARQGYVVLIFDPIGQGERLQYGHVAGKGRPRPGVGEHLHAGNQQFLVGEFFGTWRAWDGVRALDYLLTRPEVDPKHVGITGNSGGGTMTTWLCGLDTRWTMAAPACFVTTFRRDLENELPQDTEQCPPRAIALGLDHADFLAAMAPKPVAILAKEGDYFDVRGAEEAFARLRRLYALLGAEGNVSLHVGPGGRGYSRENREAMYRWFNRFAGVSDAKGEPPLTIETDETLYAAPGGQLAALKPRTVFAFTAAKAKELSDRRPKPDGERLRAALTAALRMPPREGVPEYRILRPAGNRRYPTPHATTYAVETEPGVFALVTRLSAEPHDSRPPRGETPAILYVSHQSADAELRDEPLIRELMRAEPTATVYAVDVRGVGDSRPDTCGPNSYLDPYGSDYFYAIYGLMLDRPVPGQRTFDVLRVLDWLAANGHRRVHLAAKGWGAIPGAFGAVLSDAVARVTLKHALRSYREVAESEEYGWPLSALVPNALATFDLPDCYAALSAKGLRQIEPRGAAGP